MERIAHIAAQRLLTKRHEELEGQGPSRKDDDAPGSAAGGFIDGGGAVARTSESPCREDGRAGRQQRLGQKSSRRRRGFRWGSGVPCRQGLKVRFRAQIGRASCREGV